MKFPLKSVESSEFNEVVQIDHQKICMTESGYNQILVIIDHFTKLAEAVPCQTASAEETCDHLITHWISRYGCPMTFQSDNGKAFVGDLTKELMRRSHIAQAHSTTYHPQTNGLVERQNRTLVNMLRVYCSRYMTDWDKYLPKVVGAYNSTQHSTTGISPFMMLTGRERSMPLTFFYPEYEGKRTSPQAYVKEAIKRQQELNELCRRNTAQAQMRQRRKYDEKILQAKPYEVGQYVWVFQNVIPPKGTKKLLKKWRGPFMITEVHQQGRFYRLSTGRAAHYENLKPHVPSPEDWCIPKDMEGLEYLVVEPACEVNEKGTREKNDGNENLSLDDNEKIEVESEAGSFVEEDWNDPEQDEQLEAIKDVLERNEEVFSRHKADIGCCNFVEHEIELEEHAVPHREGARRMTPHKSEACRKEIETLLEYDMIEPSKSPWACGVVMAKKKGDQLRFCCDFRYLNSVTVKDAYPIPRIDESLSKLGDAKFLRLLI